MESEELPSLYQSADKGSNSAQSQYLWMIRVEFLLLIVVSALANFRESYPWVVTLSIIILGLLVILLVSRYNLKLDAKWYQCRALAESVKTISWRFSMRAHPYEDAKNIAIPTHKFLSNLAEVQSTNQFIGDTLDADSSDKPAISDGMFAIRKLSVEDRLKIYLDERVRQQRAWYARKAKYNRRRSKQWFFFALFSYIFATTALLQPNVLNFTINWMFDPLVVLVTSSFVWLQVKKHGELAGSYLLTAHEIGHIQGRQGSVNSEESLSDFVNEAEFAFSREHTQWSARRDSV